MLDQIKNIALRAAEESGRMLKKEYVRFNRLEVMLKSHHEILTKADLMSQEIIIGEIKKHFPSHGIIAEEQGRTNNYSEYAWYIDPIDGTTNFSMHNPLWSISIALAKAGKLIFGLVYAPMLEELY